MDNTKLVSTRRKLTLIFTLVIFILFILLGSVFLATRYYNQQRQEKNDFLKQVNDISILAKSREDLAQSLTRLQNFKK